MQETTISHLVVLLIQFIGGDSKHKTDENQGDTESLKAERIDNLSSMHSKAAAGGSFHGEEETVHSSFIDTQTKTPSGSIGDAENMGVDVLCRHLLIEIIKLMLAMGGMRFKGSLPSTFISASTTSSPSSPSSFTSAKLTVWDELVVTLHSDDVMELLPRSALSTNLNEVQVRSSLSLTRGFS